MDGRGPAPLLELASWSPPLPTTSPPLDNFAAPFTWDYSTNQINPSLLPNRHRVPPTADAHDAGQTAPTTEPPTAEPIPPHPPHPSSFKASHSGTDFAIKLLKPLPTQRCVVLSRIETHVYLDIGLPSRSWNAIPATID
jgi:hypothetical protein